MTSQKTSRTSRQQMLNKLQDMSCVNISLENSLSWLVTGNVQYQQWILAIYNTLPGIIKKKQQPAIMYELSFQYINIQDYHILPSTSINIMYPNTSIHHNVFNYITNQDCPWPAHRSWLQTSLLRRCRSLRRGMFTWINHS